MEFNEWVIFIKESRDWYINKWYYVDNCLIKNHDVDEDVVTAIINLLRYLFNDFMRILLVL